MTVTKKLHFNLQLFSEGGAAGGTASGTSAGEGASGDSSQAAAVDTGDKGQNPADDRAALYQKFKADFKSEYDAEVQGLVKSRLKKSTAELNAANQYRSKAEKILATVADKYGIDSSDLDTLMSKVQEDDAYYEDLAIKNGTTPEQERRFSQVQRENAYFKAKQAADERRAAQQRNYEILQQQSDETKAMYPDFDLITESENNPTFRKLVQNGVHIKNAYEVTHKDEIMARGMQYAAQQAAAKTQASINANSKRPGENGLNHSVPADTKVDVKSLTSQQMQDYIRRIRNGESISFD